MSQVPAQAAFLLDACKLINFATTHGFIVTGGELWRTPEQQQVYFKTKRSKTMKSNHLKRMAIDLNFFMNGEPCYDKEKIRPVGAFWEYLCPHNRWGGNFNSIIDVPHFERNEP